MRTQAVSLLLATVSAVAAQTVSGTAYGFASGVTGGGDAAAATPASVEELAEWLSDDTARTIVIDKEYDFTGTTKTEAGCDRKSCSASDGGQLYLGDLSCGGDDNVAVDSITYDAAGPDALKVGSNKSIIGNGKGVLKGKGLSLNKGASNVIVQGIEITNINPGIVWGGDGLDLQGQNDGVWIDHCKFSLIGRMFIVSHYDGSRITVSNNEFDGVTTTSASCNGNHYWTMMFYGEGDQVTLDKNYFHDVAGRAPKLGQDGTTGTFQAVNNFFSNMKGHAFDIYEGATAILEGNAFESVDTPITEKGASSSTVFSVADEAAASECEAQLGRACAVNSVDSSSGEWPALSADSALSTWADLKEFLVEPVAASEVASLVASSAGPGNLGSSSASTSSAAPAIKAASPAAAAESPETTPETEKPTQSEPSPAPVETDDGAEVDDEEACEADEPETSAEPAPETPEPSTPEASPEPAPEAGSGSNSGSGEEVQQWGQCGGSNWTGSTKCVAGTSCVAANDFYSQCISSAARRSQRALRTRI